MPTDNVPSDLIQEVVDILTGDNQDVEIYTQGARTGGVLVLVGTVYGLTGDNVLLLDNARIKDVEATDGPRIRIPLATVIQIKTIGA